MFARKAYPQLLEWKNDAGKKALLVTGARQVGKSFLIRHLGKSEYENLVEINLFENSSAKRALANADDASDLISRISLFSNGPLIPGKTLVFIDEIQELPDIMTMAKFLVQDGRFDYAFSGSMLGTEFKHVRSYPVGSVHEIVIRPMDFEEFCWAVGVSDGALSTVRSCCKGRRSIPDYVHDAMLTYFRAYIVVGGMPEAVARFIDSGKDLASVRELQSELVRGYQYDIQKYAGSRALNARAIFDQLPMQLDGDSRRFVLNSVDDTARYQQYRQDFVWLVNAGVALKTNLVREPKTPLQATERPGNFKLYQSDTGMLVNRYSQNVALAVYADEVQPNFGGVYENVVAQELCALGFQLFYYANKKRGEVDFVMERPDGAVLPIEVKSGRNARAHASLNHLLESDEYGIPEGIVLSRLNVEHDGKTLYLPWYATFCIPELYGASESGRLKRIMELPEV